MVFESDDWGSIRTRSKKDFEEMLNSGLGVDQSNFTKFDSLESENDLENLFSLLSQHKDSMGNHAVLTPMCIMANPDFEKIRETNFSEYFFENFTETCKRYPAHSKVPMLWRKGIEKHLFVPAFHGREHLNVSRWLGALKEGNEGLRIAFEHHSFGVMEFKGQKIPEYLGAFHPDTPEDLPAFEKIIKSGTTIFRNICGYDPTHFVAPNRESARQLDKLFLNEGIKYLTMSKIRQFPLSNGKTGRELNWLGKKNEFGQVIITRNCHFEPSDRSRTDWVDSCMSDIATAFIWGKPAVISTHRVNYIGFLDPSNSDKGLRELNRLLTNIRLKWPEIEFMTSSELGSLIG